MELLVALVLLGGLVLGIEVVFNKRRVRDALRGWAKAGAVVLAALVCLALGTQAATEALRPPASVSIGSNNIGVPSEPAFAAMVASCERRLGFTAAISAHDTEQFQDDLDAYVRGTPDDVFTVSSGERMRHYAAEGLATPVSDLWAGFGIHYSDSVRQASTGNDGEQYLVPMGRYPWAVIYRRSVFEQRGYAVPETLDELVALARRMQADGLVPLAFGDLEGWPAMGLFDILDMRLNGYQFHRDLLAGRAKWTDERVAAVLRQWAQLSPYLQPAAEGRSFNDAAADMLAGRAGMMYMGTFLGELALDPALHDDLDLFPFPVLGNAWDAERAIDAPLDGFMLSRLPRDPASAKRLLYCLGSGDAQTTYVTGNPNTVPAVQDPLTFWYTPFQRRIDAVLRSAGATAQFLDRDTRPDFADGMERFLRDFVSDPDQDPNAFLAGVQAFRDGLP